MTDCCPEKRDRWRTRAAVCATVLAAVAMCASAFAPENMRVMAAGSSSGGDKATRAKQTAGPDKVAPKPTALPEVDFSAPLAQRYCEAVRDHAAEARFKFQAAHLEELASQVEERLIRLDQRNNELKQWLAKREAFVQQATAHLVGIFSAMRPESASEQLVRLDGSTAAAILSRLDQRAASAILNDMPPEKAARLASIMADAARTSRMDGGR